MTSSGVILFFISTFCFCYSTSKIVFYCLVIDTLKEKEEGQTEADKREKPAGPQVSCYVLYLFQPELISGCSCVK